MHILPFQFHRINSDEYLLVNESGEYLFMENGSFHELVNGRIDQSSPYYHDLKSRHFIAIEGLPETIELISAKYRSRKRFLSNFTSLHMMVLTLRCTNDCTYCQVSAEGENAKNYDMPVGVAHKVIELIFKSPSTSIKIEFQGGEPTLNWKTLQESVLYAEKLNKKAKKDLDFVVCTNLVTTSTSQLAFYQKHNIHISTSLDGPREIHDKNRVLKNGAGTYDLFIKNLKSCREFVGNQNVNALMTTTQDNVSNIIEVIDEYIEHGFNGIFIRALNPYGLAVKNCINLSYSPEVFVHNYEKALNHIIEYNLKTGNIFVEYFATLLLARILTPFSTGFVDLQSPSGAGISAAIYDHNGNVFPADEARMLSRMGDDRFLIGNVTTDSYEEIFGGNILHEIVSKSCVEIMPYCNSCIYRTYCGSDPIRNYAGTGDIIGKRPGDSFCDKNKLIFDLLFKKLKENKTEEIDVFWSWISRKCLSEIKSPNAS